MNTNIIVILLLNLLLSCKRSEVEPGEIAAAMKGYLYIDNWGKSCNGGGLVTAINDSTYLASNSVPSAFEGRSNKPFPVWIRYEQEKPDTCVQATNRIRILSIRQRE